MSSETRHAPLALWRIAQAFINTLYNLFGAPEDLAARHTLMKKERDLVLDWLRAGEALMRRLVVDRSGRLCGRRAAAIVQPPSQTPPTQTDDLHRRASRSLARQLPLYQLFPRLRGKCQRAKRDDEGGGATSPLRSLRDHLPRKRGRS